MGGGLGLGLGGAKVMLNSKEEEVIGGSPRKGRRKGGAKRDGLVRPRRDRVVEMWWRDDSAAIFIFWVLLIFVFL